MQFSRDVKRYQSDSSTEEWAFAAPYLSLLPEDAVQRRHDLRRVFDGLKWIAWTGAPWRALPHDFPPWRLSISRRCGGLGPACSRRWGTICGYCCGSLAAERSAPPPPFSTAARCNPPPRAGPGPAMMAPNA